MRVAFEEINRIFGSGSSDQEHVVFKPVSKCDEGQYFSINHFYPCCRSSAIGGITARVRGCHLVVENSVYDFANLLIKGYLGGYWEYCSLSNGEFYMHPVEDAERVWLSCENGFNEALTPQDAGIVVCLYAYSHLSFNPRLDRYVSEHYHWLRDYACERAESSLILQRLIER